MPISGGGNDSSTLSSPSTKSQSSGIYEQLAIILETVKKVRNVSVNHVEEIKSAQQCVFLLTVSATHDDESVTFGNNDALSTQTVNPVSARRVPFETTREAAPQTMSKHDKLILRIWKGSARWWNLNRSSDDNDNGHKCRGENGAVRLARAEIAGYRISRHAFNDDDARKSSVVIPEVFYFSHDEDHHGDGDVHVDDEGNGRSESCCWAILSYVGKGSLYFSHLLKYDDLFTASMVKIRHEFGFDEPHPRHGRVDERESADYAMEVLENVVFPLHSFFFSEKFKEGCWKRDLMSLCCDASGEKEAWSFENILEMHQRAVGNLMKSESLPQKRNNRNEDETNGKADGTGTMEVSIMIQVLSKCLDHLQKESVHHFNNTHHTIPPVLCHMDLQPQNLMFYCHDFCAGKQQRRQSIPKIRCVLDWEEASYADPRFELLLLCRKVCANAAQAHVIWNRYRSFAWDEFEIKIGDIDPWLKLETVHSIATLILQGMNMAGGGRNPWETKNDLMGKIRREFKRLENAGWSFCHEILLNN